MRTSTRIVTLVISLSLIISYFVPMWYIDLDAPQYPEGLGLKIWLNKMSGDLNTINGLNHYIGMKKIYPDAIPELKIMPYLIGLLIALGLVVTLARKKWLYYSWASLFVISGIVGLYDFYLWGYDYGHDLDPHAAIKIADMNYQPPVLGTKQLLNFTAYSYPDIGGTIIMGSALLALLFAFVEMKRKKPSISKRTIKEKKHNNLSAHILQKSAAILLVTLFLISCSIEPQSIQYGKELCTFCKMTIADSRFGCELLTKKGKAFKFDATECMVNYIAQKKLDEHTIHSLLTTDYSAPGKLINADNSFFVIHHSIQSPMGENLAAFAEKSSAEKYDLNVLSWQQMFQKISVKN